MEHLKFETPDIVAGNIDKIGAMFPAAVTEMRGEDGQIKKGINFEVLKQLLSRDVVDGDECYEFTWVGKKAAMAEAARPITKTLRPVKEDSRDWDTTQNLYIEGDNLEVLKILQESYLGKVKMIYIDPPYNTGHDFIYRDKFQRSQQEENEQMGIYDENENQMFENTESNGRFHSDWCTMFFTRLQVAKSLLADDGAIFISIDDGELENVKKICDEIFGASNFRNTILTRRRIKSLNSQFAENGLYSMNVGFEYIIVYAKSPAFLMKALQMKKANASTKGRWDVFWSNADRPTMRYDLLGFTPETGQWRNSKEKADIAVANYQKYENEFSDKMSLEEYFQMTGIKDFIRRIPNGTGKNGGVQHWVAPSDTSLRTSNWTDIEVSQIGKEIDIPFDNPKSKQLLMELIKLLGDSNSIILDFFSGSATTAHAVMQLNAEDGGHRKFIMVQLPEPCDEKSEAFKAGYKNICEIGKERIRQAGDKIKSENPLGTQDLDIGFRVFRVDSSNMKDVYYQPEELDQQSLFELVSNIKDDRTDLDLLYACLLDWGVEIHLPHASIDLDGCTIHNVDNGALMACFNPNVPTSVVEFMAKQLPLRAVFRDSAFASDDAKINVTEIFKNLSPDTKVKVI